MKETKQDKNLQEAIDIMDTRFGKGTLCYGNLSKEPNDVIKTGSVALDRALGVGGIPKGRIIEIFGNESSGKTTIALQIIAECQKAKGKAAFIDAEHALDLNYTNNLGVNVDQLLIAKPDSGEQVFDLLEAIANTNKIDLIVVDSVAALTPAAELSGSISDQSMGAHARLMSKGLRKLQGVISKTNTTVIFTNQIRERIGIMFGNPETTTGGRALKFYASVRIEARRAELIKEGIDKIGIKSKVTIVKNKVAPPLQTVYIDIFFGKGFDASIEMINFAIQYGIISKSGSWYYYGEKKLGQGREQLKKGLLEDAKLFDEIKKATIAFIS